jgi:hypothetical protein
MALSAQTQDGLKLSYLAAIGGGSGVLTGDIVDLLRLSRGNSRAPALPQHRDELSLPESGSRMHRPVHRKT